MRQNNKRLNNWDKNLRKLWKSPDKDRQMKKKKWKLW
jgi:hypothetical protein